MARKRKVEPVQEPPAPPVVTTDDTPAADFKSFENRTAAALSPQALADAAQRGSKARKDADAANAEKRRRLTASKRPQLNPLADNLPKFRVFRSLKEKASGEENKP